MTIIVLATAVMMGWAYLYYRYVVRPEVEEERTRQRFYAIVALLREGDPY